MKHKTYNIKHKRKEDIQVFFYMLHASCFLLHASRGQTILIAAIFFLAISLTVVLGVSTPLINRIESARAEKNSIVGFYASEGVREDVLYRLTLGMSVDAVEKLLVGDNLAYATTTLVGDGKEILVSGNSAGYFRKSKTRLLTGSGASFNYGIQAGAGGIILENTSSVVGNAYSNGPINNGIFIGSVVSAGPAGFIGNVISGPAYAHSISDSFIVGDAYYNHISDSIVIGWQHPNSPDQATSSFPISDAQIAEFEAEAAAGGVINSPCPYKITGAITIGPEKINCNLEISGSNYTITLAGPLWVVGNITSKNNHDTRISSALGNKSAAIIADNPSNRTTSSKILIENNEEFQGSGSDGSYILLVSQNHSAEIGGEETAIEVSQGANGDILLYAPHGEIVLKNNAMMKEVTGYKIHLQNRARVRYETGLANLLFSSGPSGGYTQDGWREME